MAEDFKLFVLVDDGLTGPDGVTGPCCRDPSNRPPCSRHHSSPSIALAAVRGCKLLETSRRNSNSCVDAVAMIVQLN
ncbi:unnamed protein product [Musa acuminata var. zebrina]